MNGMGLYHLLRGMTPEDIEKILSENRQVQLRYPNGPQLGIPPSPNAPWMSPTNYGNPFTASKFKYPLDKNTNLNLYGGTNPFRFGIGFERKY